MNIISKSFELPTSADTDILDITDKIRAVLSESPINDGIVTVFIPGSTAAISTIEYEEGVIEDLRRAINRLIPKNHTYLHDAKWGDGNGYSHVRSAIMKPSLTIPINGGEMLLGTWQQVVLIDFDNRARNRRIILQIIGK